MDAKKLEKIKDFTNKVNEFTEFMYDKVVWEKQENQPDHFDRLNKAERVALIGIYSKLTDLSAELNRYFRYFQDEEE